MTKFELKQKLHNYMYMKFRVSSMNIISYDNVKKDLKYERIPTEVFASMLVEDLERMGVEFDWPECELECVIEKILPRLKKELRNGKKKK